MSEGAQGKKKRQQQRANVTGDLNGAPGERVRVAEEAAPPPQSSSSVASTQVPSRVESYARRIRRPHSFFSNESLVRYARALVSPLEFSLHLRFPKFWNTLEESRNLKFKIGNLDCRAEVIRAENDPTALRLSCLSPPSTLDKSSHIHNIHCRSLLSTSSNRLSH
jgi:hypothetical protein